jgi:hypothetical protein
VIGALTEELPAPLQLVLISLLGLLLSARKALKPGNADADNPAVSLIAPLWQLESITFFILATS